MAFLGMDVEAVRAEAQRVRTAQQRLADEHQALHQRILQSHEFWIGSDADQFRERWTATTSPQWEGALDRLLHTADTAESEVDQQDAASTADGDGATSDGGDGAARTAYDGEAGDVPIDPDVRNAWMNDMNEQQRRAVLQEMVDQEFERYGMEPVDITYFYEEPDPDSNLVTFGSWSEDGQTLKLNEYLLSNPDLMLTTVHEVRHAAQHEFIEQTDPGLFDWLPGVDSKADDYERIEEDYGITRDEIEAWRENFDGDNYISPDEDFEAYQAQPVEVDAREREDGFAGDLTFEELQRYQRDAGVPVSEKRT